jgi:hypothetical protein
VIHHKKNITLELAKPPAFFLRAKKIYFFPQTELDWTAGFIGPHLRQSKCNKISVVTRTLATNGRCFSRFLSPSVTLKGRDKDKDEDAPSFPSAPLAPTPRAARAARLQDVVLKEEKALAKGRALRID